VSGQVVIEHWVGFVGGSMLGAKMTHSSAVHIEMMQNDRTDTNIIGAVLGTGIAYFQSDIRKHSQFFIETSS
jgi:hypothetical protein